MQRARAGLKRWALLRTAVAAIALVAVLGGPRPASAAHTRMSFEFFASNLEPFGSWHVSASYGRVWIPTLQVIGWHPYAYGHWVYTDFGWTWVSDYEWGAIPYHYGTWVVEPELGWVWVPGYVWAPAWVVFRTGPSYVGWAPVPPNFSVGMSFSFSNYGPDHFVFVREPDFGAPHIHRYALPRERSRVVFNDTTVINNIRIENNVVVNRGLDVQRIERVARAPVERAPIERVPKVAPVERVSRDELRVDPGQMERGRVRVAAPTAERAPERARPQQRSHERGREREPSVRQPREEPRGGPREREPQVMQPKREQPRAAPRREREPQVMQPQREEPRAMPQREEPRAQPREPRVDRRAPEPRGPEPGLPSAGPERPRETPQAAPRREERRGGPPAQRDSGPEQQPQEQRGGGHKPRG